MRETTAVEATTGPRWRRDLASGLSLGVLLMMLAIGARLSGVAAVDLRLDQDLAAGRSNTLTSMALLLTTLAQPAVGLTVAVIGPVVLTLLRRRVVALRIFVLFAFALGGAGVVKIVVREPRPPAILAAVTADTGHSFPSGHVTVAAAMAAAVWMLLRPDSMTWRVLLGGGALAFALGAGWSRLYLGVHYLPDVIGSYLVVASATLLTNAFCAAPGVRPLLVRLASTA